MAVDYLSAINQRGSGLNVTQIVDSLVQAEQTPQENQIQSKIDARNTAISAIGEIKSASETGDGPVDAIFKCIKKLYAHEVKLLLYNVHAVTEGTDAQATVSVRIEEKGKTTVGQAADTDTLVASANAYLSALNKLIIKRKKTAPDDENLSVQI